MTTLERHLGSSADGRAGSGPVPHRKTTLRDNLESIAIAILLVLALRQMVMEAFKIPTGSMAPTLLGEHKEVRCPNCGWVFRVGNNKPGPRGEVLCQNCLYRWQGAGTSDIVFRKPAWLWNAGRTEGKEISGRDAANRVDRWGSRIFVNKFIYQLRKPRRWEVIVFMYPYYRVTCQEPGCRWEGNIRSTAKLECPDCGSTNLKIERKNFVKRLIGLPGEEIVIGNGDIYIDGKIARKPPAVQKRMWQHVFDSRFWPGKKEEVFRVWDFGLDEGFVSVDKEDGSLRVAALDAETPVEATFGHAIKDYYSYNGDQNEEPGGGGKSGKHEVGDCRIEAELTVEEARASPSAGVVLRIVEDEHDFSFFVPAGQAGRAVLSDNGRPVAEAPVEPLRPGKKETLALENYDDRVVCTIGGTTVVEHEYTGNPTAAMPRKSVSLGVAGARLVFRRVRIQRDVYYTPGEGPRTGYQLDKNSYLVLGDNSPDSSDSRAWPEPGVPAENLIGEAFAIFWPIEDLGLLTHGF